MEDTRVYGRYMLVAIPEKGKPFKVSEAVTLCEAEAERGEWQEHYGCNVVFFEVPNWKVYTVATPEWQGPIKPRNEKTNDIQVTSH